ncbi:MAG: NADH-quinone oxidoreductase subunit NuoH [Deferrisomatales bacterium]
MLDLLIESVVKVVVVFAVLMLFVAYTTWLERRVLGRIQVRRGPNRVGPFGLLQPIADGIKGFFKEDLVPAHADKVAFVLGPALSIVPALLIVSVIPFGDTVTLFGREIPMRITDLNIAILFILGLAGLGDYGVVVGAWGSNNRYGLLGAMRTTAQMISYELAMGLTLISVIMVSGSLSLVQIVEGQTVWWNCFKQPVAFVLFLVCGLAEINRTPFDMPEAESELACGFNIEYSSMKFAMFFMAEYAHAISLAAIITCLFLGGWHLPFVATPGFLKLPVFLGKVFVLVFFFIWERGTFPRFRYDQIMNLGWKVLMPIALANIFVTGLVITAVA